MIAIDESRVQIRRRMRGPTREFTLDTIDDFCWLTARRKCLDWPFSYVLARKSKIARKSL
jgi:hypothetical protein